MIVLLLLASGLFFQDHATRRIPTRHFRLRVAGNPGKSMEAKVPAATSTLQIAGRIGTSVIELSPAGFARFQSSPCPNQVCVRAGWISAPFAIPCVPNGILLEAVAAETPLDGVTY